MEPIGFEMRIDLVDAMAFLAVLAFWWWLA